jgi:antirestriction protein ArdC
MRTRQPWKEQAMQTDVYQRITDQIVCELEKGVRPWLKPWNAEHAAGRITRPLRGNRIPYRGINVLVLWSAAMEKGYAAPVWVTFKQANELKANVRKGEHGSPRGVCRQDHPHRSRHNDRRGIGARRQGRHLERRWNKLAKHDTYLRMTLPMIAAST